MFTKNCNVDVDVFGNQCNMITYVCIKRFDHLTILTWKTN